MQNSISDKKKAQLARVQATAHIRVSERKKGEYNNNNEKKMKYESGFFLVAVY